MPQPGAVRPSLPSQRSVSSSSTDSYESSRSGNSTVTAGRLPLGELTGNVQSPPPGSTALGYPPLCSEPALPMSMQLPGLPILAPPVLPTQSLGSNNFPSAMGGVWARRQQRSQRPQKENPFYLHPNFQTYRNKQTENKDKEGQKWPEFLEDFFLDGVFSHMAMFRTLDMKHGLTSCGSTLAHPADGSQEIHNAPKAVWQKHAHQRVPLGSISAIARARRKAGYAVQAHKKASV